MQGGRGGLCDMGTRHFSFSGFLSCLFVFQAHTACFYLSNCHNAITFMHENCKANKTSQEKEAKDASSTIYVKTKGVETPFLKAIQHCCVTSREFSTMASAPLSSFGLLAM